MTRYNLCLRELNSLLGAAKELEARSCDIGTPYTEGEADAARKMQEEIRKKIEVVKGMQDFAASTKNKILEAEADGK